MDLTNIPNEFVGLSLGFLLAVLVVALYEMRDPTPFPRRVARRLWCPHDGRKFTVEFNERGTLCSCSAFRYGELSCNQACTRFVKAKNIATVALRPQRS